jgi:hypothetical protein
MANPFVQAFQSAYQATEDRGERERLKRDFATQVVEAHAPLDAMNVLIEAGEGIGEDMSRYFFPDQGAGLLSPEEQKAVRDAAFQKASVPRRVLSTVAQGLDWYQTNVTEPAAAVALAGIGQLVPGESQFEKQLREVRSKHDRDRSDQSLLGRMGEFADDAASAYRQTKMVFGLKGFSELLFDPLIIWGAGLPKAAQKSLPKALKPFVAPLRLIDEAPTALLDKSFNAALTGLLPRPVPPGVLSKHPEIRESLTAIQKFAEAVPLPIVTRGLKDVPVISKLAQPHLAAQANQALKEGFSATAAAFGPDITSHNPAVTQAALSSMDKFPQDLPLRKMMTHIMDDFKDETAFQAWKEGLYELEPVHAALAIGGRVKRMEEAAIRKGGKRLGGEVVEGVSERRQAGVKSFMQQLAVSEEQAAWVGRQVDGVLQGLENFAIRKLEPNITRPWATAHLAFAGYMPFNVADDVMTAVLGMGVHPFGVSDDLYLLVQAGLTPGSLPPADLLGATGKWKNTFDLMTGTFDRPPKQTTMQKVGDFFGALGVRKSGEISTGLRRSAWTRDYFKHFDEIARGAIPAEQMNELQTLIKGELPQNLGHLHSDIAHHVLAAMTTGDPAAVRQVGQMLTADKFLRKVQMGIISKYPEMAPDVRRLFIRAVDKAGGVRPDNVTQILSDARGQMLNHLAFTPTGISARFDDLLLALGTREPKSPEEALSLMRMLQASEDALNDLPHEIRAWAAHKADSVPLNKRGAIWDESLRDAERTVGEVRVKYEQALTRSKPMIEKQLAALSLAPERQVRIGNQLNSAFEAKLNLSRSLQRTWESYRGAVEEHFAKFPPEVRDEHFWREFRSLGQGIWEAHRTERAVFTRQAREAWTTLFDNLPKNLSPKGRSFAERSLWHTLEETDNVLNELRTKLIAAEERLPGLTPNLQTDLFQQMELTKSAILSTKVQRDELMERLKVLSPGRRTVPQEAYQEYNKNIGILHRQMGLADQKGMPTQPVFDRIQALTVERDKYLESLLTPLQAREWHSIKGDPRAAKRFVDNFFEGATADSIRTTRELISRVSNKVVQAGGRPNTLDDVTRIVGELAAAGDPDALALVRGMGKVMDDLSIEARIAVPGEAQTLSTEPEQIYERIYGKAVDITDRPVLTPVQHQTLLKADKGDLVPTAVLTDLVQQGYVDFTPSPGGRWATTLTDRGQLAVETSAVPIDIGDVLAELPPAVKAHETVVDGMMEKLDGLADELVKTWDNPPLTTTQEGAIRGYANRVAQFMDSRPDMQEAFKLARQEAGQRTNADFTKFTVRYDSGTNFDYIMQRAMVFWMFESRRFPRLMRLAAKRPILSKYFAGAITDQDFGYVPGPWGLDFSPFRGTMATTIRNIGRRDYPELYGGFRGRMEESMDWFGRFGFFLSPPFQATAQFAATGELAPSIPSSVNLVLHGLLATPGFDQLVPEPLQRLALNDRYMEFATNLAIADLFEEKPERVRAAADVGDDDAIAKLDMARREALRHLILANQTSMARYRPQSRRDYVAGGMEAVTTYTGLDQKTIEVLRRLGVAYDELITVSSAQKDAIRAATPNYESQIGVALALRPKAEQEIYWAADKFWTAIEGMRNENLQDRLQVSNAWEQQHISGPDARRMISDLNRERAVAFNAIRGLPQFNEVAVTLEERQAHAVKFGRASKLASPVDEALEQYYSITVDQFTDPLTLEVDWDGFYNLRESTLRQWPPEVRSTVEEELQRSETPLEKQLKIMDRLRPAAVQAQKEYNRMANLAALTADPRLAAYYQRKARQYLASFPVIAFAEAQVRKLRIQLRRQDPNVERAYQLFIRNV